MDAESFTERIEALKLELKDYGPTIVKHTTALYSSLNLPSMDLKSDPRNVIRSLRYDINDIIKSTRNNAEFSEQHSKDIEHCGSLIAILESIENAAECVENCEESINGIDFTATCRLMVKMDASMTELPSGNSEYGTGNVVQALRREATMLRSRFQYRLLRLCNVAITVEYGKVCVFRTLHGLIPGEDMLVDANNPVNLSDIWSSLLAMNSFEECILAIFHAISVNFILPLWKEQPQRSTGNVLYGSSPSQFIIRSSASAEDSASVGDKKSCSSISFQGDSQGHIFSQSTAEIAVKNTSAVNYLAGHVNLPSTGPCRVPFPLLLDHVGTVLQFIASDLLCGDAELIEKANEYIYGSPVFLGKILVATLTSLIPVTECALVQFQKTVDKCCRDFEAKCAVCGFPFQGHNPQTSDTSPALSANQNTGKKLSDVMSDLTNSFAENRRLKYLSQAREILLSDYHNTMLGTGDALEDSLSSAGDIGDTRALLEQSGSSAMQALRFDSCQVSLAACRLLKLMHEIMREACSSSAPITNILFQTARDCLELFIAIVPAKFANVIDVIPRMGVVFYNDCAYISHNVTLLTFVYRKELMGKADSIVQSSVGFVDYIARFRSLGDKCLAKHVDDQKQVLLALAERIGVCPSGDLNYERQRSLTQNARDKTSRSSKEFDGKLSMNNEEGAGLIVNHFENLRGQWNGMLQDAIYERVLGYLVECVVRVIMHPVLEAECIAEAAAGDIGRIFKTISKLSFLFAESDGAITKAVVSWSKFEVLADLLEYSLSEVAEWLPKRKFASFSGHEMNSLIRALFEDTPRRQSILTLLLEMTA